MGTTYPDDPFAPTPEPGEFRAWLTEVTRERGSLLRLATHTDVPPATLRTWRRGSSFPRPDKLRKVLEDARAAGYLFPAPQPGVGLGIEPVPGVPTAADYAQALGRVLAAEAERDKARRLGQQAVRELTQARRDLEAVRALRDDQSREIERLQAALSDALRWREWAVALHATLSAALAPEEFPGMDL